MNPNYVDVGPDGMHMEFHGGFDHFGFDVRRTEDEWVLSWYTEHGDHRLLGLPIIETNMANKASQATSFRAAPER